MSLVILASLLVRLAALGWSVAVWRRLRDWRAGFLTLMLAGMVVPDALALGAAVRAGAALVRPDMGEVAHLGVSGLALAAVAFLDRLLQVSAAARRELRVQHAYLEHLFDASPEGIVLLDNDDRVLRVNAEFTRMFGYTPQETVARRVNDLIVPDDRKDEGLSLTDTVAKGHTVSVETVRQRKDGRPIPVSILGAPIQLDGGRVGVYGIYRDITARKQAEAALRESEERYALAALGGTDGLWDWNLRSGEVYYSPRWKAQLGYEEGEIAAIPDEWFGRVHPEDGERLRADLDAHLAGTSPHFESEYRIQQRDGSWRWMLSRGLAVRDAGGAAYRLAGSQTDITDRKNAEQQLQFDALHDALTGLPNRALFVDRLGHALRRGERRRDHRCAVLFLDLDRFKVINDSLGHAVGDQLLQAMAERLQRCVRPGDTVARLGGDEFVVLLEDVASETETRRVAERIHQELSQPLALGRHEVHTTTSIGIALSSSDYEQPDALLRDADLAMFRAKALGKARSEVFDASLHERAVARLELESDLRHAVERGELVLAYQPIVSLVDGQVIGLEALLRWNHPTRGAVVPNEFIPVAEETGLILSLGEYVLETATRRMREWQEAIAAARSVLLHVNLSGRQFAQRNLVQCVDEILRRTGLPPNCLVLEITESVVMEDARATETLLTQLKSLNVQLQIDDFGTGYSSLSYLHSFPIDTLKIDRSFVTNMGAGGENSEIVRSIISLARDLGMDVIAEGVETAEQVALLRTLGCVRAQGHYFAEPATARVAEELLRNGWRARVS